MEPSIVGQLTHCRCCPRECGANRMAGETGFCGIGSTVHLSYAGLHFGEEPPISGSRGSGTVFFAGCNLRCVFCQNYQISQEFRQHETRPLTRDALVQEMLRLQDEGAHNINFVSPSHVVLQMADAIVEARRRGLAVPVVYNTNGYDSVAMLRQIRGLVDIYLPDIKYLENDLGRRYSAVDDYAEIIPDVLREMLDQVGRLTVDDDGVAVRGLLVRHLVLPSCLGNSRKCLSFLASLSPDIAVSIMSQYSPQHRACHYPQIDRGLSEAEYDGIVDYALDVGLDNAFVQELDSQDHYLPSFDRTDPFGPAPSAAVSSSSEALGGLGQ